MGFEFKFCLIKMHFVALASSSWLLLVQDSCDCFWIVVTGSIWLFKFRYSVGWFWPAPAGSLGPRPTCGLFCRVPASFRFYLMAIASSKWFLPV